MAQDKTEKNEVKEDPVVKGDGPWESEEARKLQMYLLTLSKAKTFASLHNKKKLDPNYRDFSEGPFGFGSFVFPCLQRFNNIKSFLTLCFLVTLVHGMIFALVDLNLKVYTSQLSMSPSETLVMDASDYFAGFLVSIFVAHFGGRGNRAKWVAAGSILTGLSAIAFAVPFFSFEVIKLGLTKEELCEEGKKPKVCEPTVIPHKSICMVIFIFGQFLHGLAGMPFYLLATSFIFDHVPTNSSGLYLAIADSALAIGYCLGFIGGIQNFKIPVKDAMQAVGHVQRFRILQRGWWKSYIFVAVFAFCTTLPLFCFPAYLPGAKKIRLEKSQELPTIDRRLENEKIEPNLKSVLHAIWCLLRNPLVLTQTFCKVTESMTLKASSYFLPQYLQTRFLITPSRASMLSGVFLLPGTIIGRFLGGLIVDRLEMNNKEKLKLIMIASFVSIVLFLLIFFVKCETSNFAGINDDYDKLGILGNLTAPCNAPCGCTTSVYNPVCGRDETQYFSPCFAGCRAAKQQMQEKAYYNCSCINNGLTTADTEGQYIDAVSGTCNTRCLAIPLFFAFYFSATIFSNVCSIPATLIILHVPTSWNSMSLGVMFTVQRFIGSAPGVLLFAATTDFTCNFWDINECGEKVHCWIYNEEHLVYTFQTMWINLQILTGLLCLYAVYRYDYVVKGKSKISATPVKDTKEEEG
ncbi:solute carrier organic anion transporter family member 6A1-like isoform X2 [Mastomys coucha]|uniref:solute carrier organic anion transporter family member 6A1-like isoform X2 n=1 Tax=Mastomys coucha TaxID=35658 RepID=UPI0012626C87|nr:solute carrier organic anion transporter family member 6A1-like isoform X2 [Mastomys coucha]